PECDRGDAAYGERNLPFRNSAGEVNEERIVVIPKVDQITPLHFPVSMRLHPLILGITLSAKFAVNRRRHETDMVVCRRLDQVAQLFFARPAGVRWKPALAA